MSRPYRKPALTIEQQIKHLRSNGMVVEDDAVAAAWLQHVSYYRLSA